MEPRPKVNAVEIEEEAGSLWRRRSSRWGKRRRGRWGREEVPYLQIQRHRVRVWSALVLILALAASVVWSALP
jgi:hypothetical protein